MLRVPGVLDRGLGVVHAALDGQELRRDGTGAATRALECAAPTQQGAKVQRHDGQGELLEIVVQGVGPHAVPPSSGLEGGDHPGAAVVRGREADSERYGDSWYGQVYETVTKCAALDSLVAKLDEEALALGSEAAAGEGSGVLLQELLRDGVMAVAQLGFGGFDHVGLLPQAGRVIEALGSR